MNQHINKLVSPLDPDVQRLRKELFTEQQVRAAKAFRFPRIVWVPAKRRPIPSGSENRRGILS